MSAVNPTHIIAEHAVKYTEFGDVAVCMCGGRFFDDTSDYTQADEDRGVVRHSQHLVSKLSDAGYSIVPAESAWTLSRAQALAFGTERMNSGDVEYSRGYNTAVDSFRDVLRVADVEGEKP